MRVVATFASLLILSGCASTYSLPSNQPSATLSFQLSTDSTDTTAKGFQIDAYEDLSCAPAKHGSSLASKRLADDQERLGPVKVSTDQPFTFAVAYSEARFAQNKSCSFTAAFWPATDQVYSVQFKVVKQSAACGLQITDSRGNPVRYEAPQMSCAEGVGGGKTQNGGAGILNWTIRN